MKFRGSKVFLFPHLVLCYYSLTACVRAKVDRRRILPSVSRIIERTLSWIFPTSCHAMHAMFSVSCPSSNLRPYSLYNFTLFFQLDARIEIITSMMHADPSSLLSPPLFKSPDIPLVMSLITSEEYSPSVCVGSTGQIDGSVLRKVQPLDDGHTTTGKRPLDISTFEFRWVIIEFVSKANLILCINNFHVIEVGERKIHQRMAIRRLEIPINALSGKVKLSIKLHQWIGFMNYTIHMYI